LPPKGSVGSFAEGASIGFNYYKKAPLAKEAPSSLEFFMQPENLERISKSVEGRFVPASWLDVIFNASFPYRLAHTVTGFYLTTAFAVLGATAWHLKHRRNVAESRAVMGMTVIFIAIFVPIQITAGDLHGLNTLHHQPLKVAAMEGLWDTQARAPAVLFAIPDEKAERNRAEIAIPALASIYLAHSPDAVIKGLKEAPPSDRPPVAPVFFAFRIMVGIGVLMLGMAVWGVWLRWRGRLYTNRLYQNACIAMIPAGFSREMSAGSTTWKCSIRQRRFAPYFLDSCS